MPLYEYACQECTHTFEMLVFTGEKAHCPTCESENLQRLLSVPAAPKTEMASLPTACRTAGPPCGPVCSRFGQS